LESGDYSGLSAATLRPDDGPLCREIGGLRMLAGCRSARDFRASAGVGPGKHYCTAITTPLCVVAPPKVALNGMSPLGVPGGTTTLNWNRPGLTRPANRTVAWTPPIVTTGSDGKVPDCTGARPFAHAQTAAIAGRFSSRTPGLIPLPFKRTASSRSHLCAGCGAASQAAVSALLPTHLRG